MSAKQTTIDLRLFSSLVRFQPVDAGQYRIEPGVTIEQVLVRLAIPLAEAKLIFVNGVKRDLETILMGGERVGIFPPVGGG